ncbi:copper homeostasis protein CutC [Actinomyces provencensis]|uniref:copper homeostasis protein CutC n=1 Tax=Actinomyces provencensis TaxID=1720198 RepID=UPI00096A8008|nr:copper homeostasis protein CutC [Actinomyces provencensis]
MTRVEICVEDAAGVRAASQQGADRVEVCHDLSCGGLTPSDLLVSESLPLAPPDGVQVLIRPRPDDFVFSGDEVAAMCTRIRDLRTLVEPSGVEVGFVIGALQEDHRVDESALARLMEAAGPARVTFHRAFDLVPDRREALGILVRHGVRRVLTTGGGTGKADVPGLRALVKWSRGEILVLASGGLRSDSVVDVIRRTGAPEVHMRAPAPSGSGTDPDEVGRIVAAVRHHDSDASRRG